MTKKKVIDLYIDAEWFINQRVFLLGYSHGRKECIQIYGSRLTRKQLIRLLKKVNGHIFCYGPDIGMLEKFFRLKIRTKYRCVNLLKVFRDCLKEGSLKLKHLEKRFGIKRKVVKYKANIFKIWRDWLDPRKKKAVLRYNREDVINLAKLTKLIFTQYKIRASYLERVRLK